MKIIALLSIGAALALAAGQDQEQKPPAPKPATTTKAPARPTHAAVAAVPLEKRKLNQRAGTPPVVNLTPEQKAAAALPTVPEGAQLVGANLYRLTDAQGKTWMYRKTPFGVSKWEEKPGEQTPAAAAPSPAGITTTDLGDSVQFQRQTPFGPQKWTRKKSEMTDEEKAAFAAKGGDAATKPDPAKPVEKQ